MIDNHRENLWKPEFMKILPEFMKIFEILRRNITQINKI